MSNTTEHVNNNDENKIISLKTLEDYFLARNNAVNSVYLQDVPEICKVEACILGVDEAGRGPVLGPMVYGISFCPKTKEKLLEDLGCADSKQLTEGKRDEIFEEIHKNDEYKNNIGWAVEVISPNVISTNMNKRTKCSLNEISMDSAIGLIHKAIEGGVNISDVYVDTVGPPEKYQAKLKAIFPYFNITVAKKADSTYPIVSAASICAKVTRDHVLKVWKFPEGLKLSQEQFGSGYPGDPVTKSFLVNNIDLVFGFPRLVRFSWSTSEKALEGKAYDMIFEDPSNDENKNAAYGGGIGGFFKKTNKNGEPQRIESEFMKERFLESATDI